uniref:Protein Z, vitamin K dependent plasma glycoprotein n=1 Tax=Moschus moschiferus TaxID=68415 RepID=A0A8C6CM42_MOSMO
MREAESNGQGPHQFPSLAEVLALPSRPAVFLPASKAHELLARWRRAGSYLLEELFEGHLEKECFEEICVYEEAREVFEHDEPTVRIPTTHSGSPCASQPCLNNGSCRDSIRSYTCTCAPGYEGPNCAFAKNECHPLRLDGCQHFCHPGPESYMCSCARGHKLGQDHRSCLPHGVHVEPSVLSAARGPSEASRTFYLSRGR